MKQSFIKTVIITGLIVGTFDITAAHLHQLIKTGIFPTKLLQYIAGGALGLETAMQGDVGVQLLGLLFHYFIAFSFTLLFFLLYPALNLQSYNKYLVGILYGPLIGAFMAFIVLPLTKLPQNPFVFQKAIVGWLILSVAIGIPVAISASKYYQNQHKTTK